MRRTSWRRISLELWLAGNEARLMRLHRLLNFGEHIGMIGSDVSFFRSIAAQMKQQRRVVGFRLWLAVADLRFEMGLPFAEATGEELIAAIIEVRPLRQFARFKQQGRNIPTVDGC